MALQDPVDYFFNPESESLLLLTSPLLIPESSDLVGNHDCVSTSCATSVSPAVRYLLAPTYPKAIKKRPRGAQDLPKRHWFNVRQNILGQWGHSSLLWALQYHELAGGHDWGTAAHAGLWSCWICAVHSSTELLPRQTTAQINRKVGKKKKEIIHYTCQDDKDWARSPWQVRAGAVTSVVWERCEEELCSPSSEWEVTPILTPGHWGRAFTPKQLTQSYTARDRLTLSSTPSLSCVICKSCWL